MFFVLVAVAFVASMFVLRALRGLRALRAAWPRVAPMPADVAGAARAETAEAVPVEPAAIPGAVAEHRRTAYLPRVEDSDGPVMASKFSGTPYLPAGEAWPACGNCGQPMQLFVQLVGDDLPAEARARIGAGRLLQLFYCTSEDPLCEVDCEAYFPHARSTLARIVPVGATADAVPPPANAFPPKHIVEWLAEADYPNDEELSQMGVALDEAEMEALADSFPRSGEKLLGWPLWIQGIEYPNCRICGERMELLFQIDSENNLPYMLGDMGVGHITQCSAHPTELAFGWACG